MSKADILVKPAGEKISIWLSERRREVLTRLAAEVGVGFTDHRVTTWRAILPALAEGRLRLVAAEVEESTKGQAPGSKETSN